MVNIKYFVHGTTLDNLAKKASGWLPGELSEKGIAQAQALAERIKDEHFDIVFCSDLKRAIDSANIDFAGRNIEIVTDFRLRECNYGDLDGLDNKLVVYEDHIKQPFPNGESMLDVESRLRNFLDFLSEKYDGKKVAIVAHKAPQLAIEVITFGKSWKEAIDTDWRKTGDWQPGWEYFYEKQSSKDV